MKTDRNFSHSAADASHIASFPGFLKRVYSGCAVVAILVAGQGWLGTARGETTNYSGGTPITSLPVTISTPGTYYLAQDFIMTVDNNGISIAAPNVTIDLNGHSITNTYGSGITSRGIIGFARPNVTIRNGAIRGFLTGINLLACANSSVENMLLSSNYVGGIVATGANTRIARCRCLLTGGTTTQTTGTLYCIRVSNNSSVEDCDVANKLGSLPYVGIQADDTSLVVNNRIVGTDYGVNSNSGSTTKYRDNLAVGVTTPYLGGVDAGNNH